ncbi:DUF5615 family PIN-like protein [Arachnia propionica]|uniref:DUF5615 family PIN-like protein n=1 Tax=Arachnia propionica TaxID=1750 RepID=UPI00163A9D2D
MSWGRGPSVVQGPGDPQAPARDVQQASVGSPQEPAGSSGRRCDAAQRLPGPRVAVDENLPPSWASGLRESGYDARSVAEMDLRGTPDAQLNQLANQLYARVGTSDFGHDLAGGFGSNAVVIDFRIRSLSSVLRILEGG